LVIQLKRFEYDVSTLHRIKVTTKFEFPKNFNIGPLLEQEGQNQAFRLTGVVLHAGTTQGGHYTSCVKIGDKWFSFDDRVVTETTEAAVLADSLGGSTYSNYPEYDNHRPSAYLLFYAKADFVETDLEYSLTEERDAALLSSIEEENRSLLQIQGIFSRGMMTIMLQETEIDLLLLYFLNVVAHSSHGILAKTFGEHLRGVIEKQAASDRVLDVLNEKLAAIEAVLIRSNDEDIIQAFLSVIVFLIEIATFDKSAVFVGKLIDDLAAHAQNWRVLPHFMGLIVSFLRKYPEWSRDNGWISRLVFFTQNILE
jgi:hypothetical protein